MTTAPVQVERRVCQRFPFLLPVSFRASATGVEGLGFTQDLSSRGAFFLTNASLRRGDKIELTLTMPSEITLGESMRIRCRAQVLRTAQPADSGLPAVPVEILSEMALLAPTRTASTSAATAAESKIAVAVLLEDYEYLPDPTRASARLAVLHTDHDEDRASFIPPQR